MLSLLLALTVSASPPGLVQRPRFFDRICPRTEGGRSSRGIDCSPYAMVELAPPGGAGVGGGVECACTAITTATGGVITWLRTGAASCTKGDQFNATVGSMAMCGTNIPRVTKALAGATDVSIQVEAVSRTEDALQTEDFGNAAWTSTAAVTINTGLSPLNALTADTITDSSGAAIQSSCQTISTTAAVLHVASVYVQAGTLAKASISMVGTGSSTGDCTNSTTAAPSAPGFKRLWCASTAAYAGTLTAITICVNVGTVVGDQGTIVAWGANHDSANTDNVGSYMPATSSSVTKDIEVNSVAAAALATANLSGSSAITIIPMGTAPGSAFPAQVGGAIMTPSGPTRDIVGAMHVLDGTNDVNVAANPVFYTAKRYWTSWAGTTLTATNATDVVTSTGTFDGDMGLTAPLQIGESGVIGQTNNWFFKGACLDPSPTRCR